MMKHLFLSCLLLLSLVFPAQAADSCDKSYQQAVKQSRQGQAQASLAQFQALLKRCQSSAKTVAEIQEQLGTLYAAQHQYPASLQAFEQAIAYWQKRKEVKAQGRVLSKSGETLLAQGDYKQAREQLVQALALREQALGKQDVELAVTLDRLAETERRLGDYAQAEPLYLRALQLREKALGAEHLDLSYTLNDLALLYVKLGQNEKAEAMYQRALAIKEKQLGPEHPYVATSLNNLALLYDNLGAYDKAAPLYQRALDIREKTLKPDDPKLARSLNNLGLLYMNLGKLDDAQKLYERALAIREKVLGVEHPDVAVSLHSLGLLYQRQQKFEQAMALYQRALWIRQRSLGADHPDIGSLLNNIAVLYRELGATEEAEAFYQHALSIRERRQGEQPLSVAHSLYNLSLLYLHAKDYPQSQALLLRALTIAAPENHPMMNWLLNYQLSRLQILQGQTAAGIFFGKLSVNALQDWRGDIKRLDKELRQAFLDDKSHSYIELVDVLLNAARLHEARQVLAMLREQEYFDFIGRDAAADLAFTQADLTPQEQSWAKEYQQHLSNLRLTEGDTNQAQGKDPAQPTHDALQSFLHSLQQTKIDEAEQLEFTVSSQVQQVLNQLGQDVGLLQYLLTPEYVQVMLSTAKGQKAYKLAYPRSEVNQQVLTFYEAILNIREAPTVAAQALYQSLFVELEEELKQQGVKTLLLGLDGSLQYVPFAALHDGKQYLAARYQFVRYNSVAPTDLLKRSSRAQWKAIGLGLSEEIPGFAPLPSVPMELRGIIQTDDPKQGLLPGQIYLNKDFNQARLQQSLQAHFPLMHIASHFVFQAGTDEASYLLLGTGEQLNLKTVRTELSFDELELLSLSACNTALGQSKSDGKGSEIEGFGSLAQHRGAQSVLATLWAVNDESTGRFMQRFYQQLLKTEPTPSKADALQAAQQAYIAAELSKEGTENLQDAYPYYYAHPYYWAPFVLMGNWL